METIKIGSLEYIVAPAVSAPHCFTTRFGGVSTEDHLSSMNIGTHRGDVWENVLKNYDILGEAVGFDPKNLVLTHQTHTDIIVKADDHRGAGLYGPELYDCDGLVTNTPGMGLVVFSADCTPIIAYDPVTGAVGAAHAGWRGTAANIAGKLIEAMTLHYGTDPKNVRAAIGPNIKQCCFQTDWDVPQAMLDAVGREAEAFIEQRGEKYYVNLTAINALFLKRAGVERIDWSEDCTCCQPHRFWSHRQVGNHRGSQGVIIVCPGRNEE